MALVIVGLVAGALPVSAQEVPPPPVTTTVVPVDPPSAIGEATLAVRTALGLDAVPASGAGVDVAIIDTGVVAVPGVPADRILYGPDLTTDARNPALRNLDSFGHGTAMASLVLAVAPQARIVSVKVGSATATTSIATILAGIEWVRKNARTEGRNIKVVSIAFGLPADSDRGVIAQSLRTLWSAGITVVVAAGNQGNGSARLDAPANDRRLLAVGAMDLDPLSVASFSSGSNGWYNRGPDLLAPGVDLVGARVPGSLLDQSFPAARVGTDGFRGSGTSQAAAVTAGAAALLVEQRPGLNPDQIKALLTTTADPLAATPRLVQGTGTLDVDGAADQREMSKLDAAWRNQTVLAWLTLPSLNLLLAPLSLVIWNGDPWNGNRWTGNRWTGNRWTGSTWQ